LIFVKYPKFKIHNVIFIDIYQLVFLLKPGFFNSTSQIIWEELVNEFMPVPTKEHWEKVSVETMANGLYKSHRLYR